MPKGLRRIHGGGDFHFITCSCYRRLQFLGSARHRDLFLNILEEVRQRYNFIVAGFVVMPEHFHILISEPKTGSLSLVMQVLKQRVSRKCRGKRRSTSQLSLWEGESAPAFWQTRYYDFNVYSGKKKMEKLPHQKIVCRSLRGSAFFSSYPGLNHPRRAKARRCGTPWAIFATRLAALVVDGAGLLVTF
jgi:putative transposase